MTHCYVSIPGARPGSRIGYVVFLESGYYPGPEDSTSASEADIEAIVAAMNKRLGVSPEVAEAAMYGSMFGWTCPAARPAVRHFASQR